MQVVHCISHSEFKVKATFGSRDRHEKLSFQIKCKTVQIENSTFQFRKDKKALTLLSTDDGLPFIHAIAYIMHVYANDRIRQSIQD